MGKQDIYLSMGTLSGVQLLSGRGPDLNLKVVPSGYMTSEIENRFDSAGINQTRHQIMLKMDMRVLAIIPGYTVATDIHYRILSGGNGDCGHCAGYLPGAG